MNVVTSKPSSRLISFASQAERLFNRYGWYFACGSALTIPWGLVGSYFMIFPLILLWIGRLICRGFDRDSSVSSLTIPLCFFFLSLFIASLFGINPGRSVSALHSMLFFALLFPATRDACATRGILGPLMCLILGQSVAAFHTVLSGAFPQALPKIFVGDVTESGQLAITIPLVLGLILELGRKKTSCSSTGLSFRMLAILSLGVTLILIGASFFRSPLITAILPWVLVIVAVSFVIIRIRQLREKRLLNTLIPSQHFMSIASRGNNYLLSALFLFVTPVLITALLVNLKRGPWAGVLISSLLLFMFLNRKLFLIVPLVVVASIFTLEPVRERLIESREHFFIAGGRSEMWDIGVELAIRFPVGVGYRNSRFLQQFSEEIHPKMTHFHNNFINILVEGGWITLCLYCWWIIVILKAALKSSSPQGMGLGGLGIAFGCMVVSWQTAGIVEYNWGDSEVRNLAFVALGIFAHLYSESKKQPSTQKAA